MTNMEQIEEIKARLFNRAQEILRGLKNQPRDEFWALTYVACGFTAEERKEFLFLNDNLNDESWFKSILQLQS